MRAIVIGADGLVGKALAAALRARGDDVIGTTRRPERVSPGQTIGLDFAGPEPASADLPAADVAFVCAAMAHFADCRKSPELAERVNFIAPAALAAKLGSRGTRVILLSTSAVLDGAAPHMAADRPRLGRSTYGRSKGEAERAILASAHGAAVVRLTKVLTPEMPLFRKWLGALKANFPIDAFTDHRIAPIALRDAVDALLAVGDRGGDGIYQASGAFDVSYFEIARHLARRIGASEACVHAVSAAEAAIPAEEITAFTSLDTSRLTALCGFQPPDPYALVDRILGETQETL